MPGRFPVIDTDIHNGVDRQRVLEFLPEPWHSRYAAGSGGHGGLGYWNPNGVFRSDAVSAEGIRIESDPVLLGREFFDVYGIEYGVLNPGAMHHSNSPEPDFAAAMCRATNDVVANDWLPADPRLLGSIVVSQTDPQQAAEEIHRMGKHPRMVQVLMGSGTQIPFGQRHFDPIYEAACAYDLPVAIHPGNEGSGIAGPPTPGGFPTSYLEWHTDLVCNYIGNLVSLLTEGTFIKFPKLKFILVEGGVAWMPPVLWRLDKNWKALRQSVPWLEALPSEYAQRHVLLTTQPVEEPENPEFLKQMLAMFDAAHMLMFSSDYPHWDGDTPDFAARAFSKELRPRVMSETARELYRLPPRVTDGEAAD